jgi:hypothetical protein
MKKQCFAICCALIRIVPPHPWAGEYQLYRYVPFGPQSFSNVSLPFVTLSDPNIALSFCTRNLTSIIHLRGKLVGLVYPFFTSTDPYEVEFAGGCAYERIVSIAADVGVAGVLFFSAPIDHGLSLLYFARCRNCSVFTGEAITFPCVYVPTTLGYPMWYNYVMMGNQTFPPFPETIATLIGPDQSYFEWLNQTVGYTFQAILSAWTMINIVLASMFIFAKISRNQNGTRKHAPFLALATLCVELLCNLWRFTFVCVDPWLTNGIYPVLLINDICVYFFY